MCVCCGTCGRWDVRSGWRLRGFPEVCQDVKSLAESCFRSNGRIGVGRFVDSGEELVTFIQMMGVLHI